MLLRTHGAKVDARPKPTTWEPTTTSPTFPAPASILRTTSNYYLLRRLGTFRSPRMSQLGQLRGFDRPSIIQGALKVPSNLDASPVNACIILAPE